MSLLLTRSFEIYPLPDLTSTDGASRGFDQCDAQCLLSCVDDEQSGAEGDTELFTIAWLAGDRHRVQPPAEDEEVRRNRDQSFSFSFSFMTILPCATLAVRSCSGTFLCTKF